MTTDENGNRIPKAAYATIAMAIVVPTITLIIWLSQLGSRLDTVETRGTPAAAVQLEAIRDRLAIMEERQRVVQDTLKSIYEQNKITQAQIEVLQRALPIKP